MILTKSKQVLLGLMAISLGALVMNSKKLICGIRGHDDLMEFESNRFYLYCPSCGHKSHGITIDKPIKREVVDV